jgi:hypothetical protein
MKLVRATILTAVVFLCVLWSLVGIFAHLDEARDTNFMDLQVGSVELVLFAYFCIVVAGVVLAFDAVRGEQGNRFMGFFVPFRRPITYLLSAVAFSPQAPHISGASQSHQSMPVQSVFSPTIAAAALSSILRKRRDQVRNLRSPDSLTDDEIKVLHQLVQVAGHTAENAPVLEKVKFPQEVEALLVAVDRPAPQNAENTDIPESDWTLALQIFGYPQVVNRLGETAKFDKRRALELVTWMALNRDRSRRSAARTAMWDEEISDSTFSTILSAMRRGLGSIDNAVTPTEWSPPTYSDELALSSRITSDDVLMSAALRRFRADESEVGTVLKHLSWVRDVPFAGTAYSWADLDGTTTRLVILALTASREVATWASKVGDMESMGIAISAGLRVMPGDEELLAFQKSFLRSVREVRPQSVA